MQTTDEVPIRELHRILIEYFENAVGNGTHFLPGQTVQVGWSLLRLCERSDDTIGVQERELTPELEWKESVDRALTDAWLQKEVAASVGLLDELAFPRQDDMALVAECAIEAPTVLLTRLPAENLQEGVSGWSLACAQDHEHTEQQFVPLLAIAAVQPGLVQFLALPHGCSVLAMQRLSDDTVEGTHWLEPHIFRTGDELAPKPGSYLAALQE